MYQSDTFRTAPRNHRVQLKKNFNSITARPSTPDFSLFPHTKTPSKPAARHHVAAEQEAQDFRQRRPALTLLTP